MPYWSLVEAPSIRHMQLCLRVRELLQGKAGLGKKWLGSCCRKSCTCCAGVSMLPLFLTDISLHSGGVSLAPTGWQCLADALV